MRTINDSRPSRPVRGRINIETTVDMFDPITESLQRVYKGCLYIALVGLIMCGTDRAYEMNTPDSMLAPIIRVTKCSLAMVLLSKCGLVLISKMEKE